VPNNHEKYTTTDWNSQSNKKMMESQPFKEFNRRDAGLKLQTFLHVFTIIVSTMKRVTLEGLAIKCEEQQYGLSMTKQSLHKRLKEGSKALKALLATVVTSVVVYGVKTPRIAEVLDQFAAVIITDSITLTLPGKLEKDHKGLGGTNAKSAMKLQASYDVKSKTFRRIAVKDNATENDAKYVDAIVEMIERNELSVTDLGYYSVSGFVAIAEKGAYFISRIKSNTIIHTEDGEPMNLLWKLQRSHGTIDMTVIIKGDANKTWMKVRLCGVKLPPTMYAERLRKANKSAAQKGKKLTADEKERLKWILVVTNVTKEQMTCEAVCEVYRIRWQIEIIFKSWRRYLAIDEINDVGKDYWDCLLYGKLIMITMLTTMYAQLYHNALQSMDKRVSYLRFMKNIREDLDILSDYWNYITTEEHLAHVINRIVNASLVETRKRKTTEQSIDEFNVPLDFCNMIDELNFAA